MPLDSQEQVELFKEYLETLYKEDIANLSKSSKKYLLIDFNKLAELNFELAEQILDDPTETLENLEIALFQINEELPKDTRIRLRELPKSQSIKLRDIRSNNLGTLLSVEGIVRQASDVRPRVVSAKFECPTCGTIHSILQLDQAFKEPVRCSCGRKGKFRLVSRKLVDAQRLILEESPESLEGGEHPKRLAIFLKEDLVEPKMEKKTTPGSKVRIIGILKEVPIPLRTGGQSTQFDLAIEANYIEPIQESFDELDVTKEEELEIKRLAKDPKVFDKIISSVAPSIFGHTEIKASLILQLLGGSRKVTEDGVARRGDIHILLVGDPGVAKSQLLQFIIKIAPKGRFVTGKGASLDFNEPLLIKENGKIKLAKIGEFVDNNCNNKEEEFVDLNKNIESLSLNLKTKKLEWKQIKSVYRHKTDQKLLKFTLESGRQVKVTKDHSIFILENGKTITKNADELKKNDCVLIPSKLPTIEKNNLHPELARLLGYYIAEGHMRNKNSSYKIEFTLNKNEKNIFQDINYISKKHLGKEAKVYDHGENGIRVVIYGKTPYYLLSSLLGDITGKRAKQKRIPEIIFNTSQESRKEFITGYLEGDAGVTKSKYLMSDLLFLYLQDNIVASFNKRLDEKETEFKGRKIKSKGFRFDLKSPHKDKAYKNRYKNPPIDRTGELLVENFFKQLITNGYKRTNENRLGNRLLYERLNFINRVILARGKELRSEFGESALEYFGDNSELFTKIKSGREMLVSLSEKGKNLMQELIEFKTLMNGDLGFARIKKIEEVESSSEYVYDISVPVNENFVGGFGGVICHNSGAGLTAAVVRDEFLKGWALEAGAMALANKGVCAIDELDKMTPEDRSALHEALEQQTISISKANIQATLNAQTTVLAAANPKLGRFDPYSPIASQVDLPPSLINRFDLIFPIRDLPSREIDEKIAHHVLSIYQNPEKLETPLNQDFIRKYISYAKQRIKPQLTNEAIDEIKTFYVTLRNSATGGDDEVKPIPISARQLEALVRLSEASAKVRLSPKVTKEDAKRAIILLQSCLMQVGFDKETGQIDIDRISSGITAAKRSRINLVKDIISSLEEKGLKTIPIEEIVALAVEKGLQENIVEEVLDGLKRVGDIFEPKRGFIQKIK